MDMLHLPVVLHTKFFSIFSIVTLTEAQGEQQRNQGF